MSSWLIIAVTIVYAWTALDLFIRKDIGHSIMFFGYAIANIGLLYAIH